MTWPGLAKENTIFLGLAWETRVAGWSLKEHDTRCRYSVISCVWAWCPIRTWMLQLHHKWRYALKESESWYYYTPFSMLQIYGEGTRNYFSKQWKNLWNILKSIKWLTTSKLFCISALRLKIFQISKLLVRTNICLCFIQSDPMDWESQCPLLSTKRNQLR